MARVPLTTRDDLSEPDRAVYDRVATSRGSVGPIWQALLNTPNLTAAVLALADELRHGVVLDKRYRELAVLTVGRVTRCAYEFDHHWNAAVRAGLPRAKLEALADFETSPLFDETERAVMRFAEESTVAGTVKPATWEAVRRFFDTRQAMEIVMTVAWYNTVVRILLPLEIENEPGFRRL